MVSFYGAFFYALFRPGENLNFDVFKSSRVFMYLLKQLVCAPAGIWSAFDDRCFQRAAQQPSVYFFARFFGAFIIGQQNNRAFAASCADKCVRNFPLDFYGRQNKNNRVKILYALVCEFAEKCGQLVFAIFIIKISLCAVFRQFANRRSS